MFCFLYIYIVHISTYVQKSIYYDTFSSNQRQKIKKITNKGQTGPRVTKFKLTIIIIIFLDEKKLKQKKSNQAFDVQVKKVSSETKNRGYSCVKVWGGGTVLFIVGPI